jgi:hypothetical protein
MKHSILLALLGLCSATCSQADKPAAHDDGDSKADAAVGVDSSTPSSTAGADAAVSAEGPPNAARLFAQDAPVWQFSLDLSKTDRAWLDANATMEQYVPAKIALSGYEQQSGMVRYKGAYGSLTGCFDDAGKLTCNKLSLKVSFNETDKNGRYLGLRKLQFHACQRDISCLRERISYGLFGDAGIEVSRTSYATVSINGGPPSLYVLVEYVDKEFLEDHFPDASGNLYKEAWPIYITQDPYLAALSTNESTANVSRFVDFASAVTGSSPMSFATDVSDFLDLSRMHRYNAVDELINNWDGIWKFYCSKDGCGNHNYYVYENPSTQRFTFIPWDLDHTWTSPNEEMGREYFDDSKTACDIVDEEILLNGMKLGHRAALCDPLMAGMMVGGWDGYRAALSDLLTSPQTSLEAVLQRMDTYRALIRPAIEADPLPPSVDEWEADVARLRQVIRASYGEAQKLLAE